MYDQKLQNYKESEADSSQDELIQAGHCTSGIIKFLENAICLWQKLFLRPANALSLPENFDLFKKG